MVDVGARRPVGTVTIYRADLANGFAYIAGTSIAEYRRTGVMVEAVGLMIEYAFTTWSFRKLYVDTLEFNLEQFRSAQRWLLQEEGRLRDHEYHRGQYWDRVTLAVTKERWQEYRHFLVSGPGQWPGQPHMPLPFDGFVEFLTRELDLDRGAMQPSSRFAEDLGLDSMSFYALTLILESLAGEPLPAGLSGQLQTVEDAYTWYTGRRGE